MQQISIQLLSFFYKKLIVQSVFLGFLWAWLVLGKSLFPWEIAAWVNDNGDAAQHYNSWILFASDNFSLPLTFTQKIAYPLGTSIVYTDSIPLFAVIFKPIYKILNYDFQYFGIYFWISSSLTFYLTWDLTRKCFKFSKASASATSLLLMTAPIACIRMSAGHESLSGHWIIMALFYLFFRSEHMTTLKLGYILFFLCFISTGIHPYLASFVITALISIAIKKLLHQDRKSSVFLVLVALTSFPFSLIFWGYFSNSGRGAVDLWSANVLALFDSQYLSKFIQGIPKIEPLQWEGFSYLGIGVILLIIILSFILIFRSDRRILIKKNLESITSKVAIITIFLLFVYALGNPIYIGKYKLLTIGNGVIYSTIILNFAHEIFRATGRYMWVVNYAIVLFAFYLTQKFIPKKIASLLLIIVVLLNFYETNIYTAITVRHDLESRTNNSNYITKIPPYLSQIIAEKKPSILISYPAFGCPVEPLKTYTWASHYKLATNNFYLARFNKDYLQYNCEKLPMYLGLLAPDNLTKEKLYELKINEKDTVIILQKPSQYLRKLFKKNKYDYYNKLYIYY
jgi:hypothetical protein